MTWWDMDRRGDCVFLFAGCKNVRKVWLDICLVFIPEVPTHTQFHSDDVFRGSVQLVEMSVMLWSCVSVAAELPLVPPSEQRISSTSLLVTDQLELKYRRAPGRSVLLICLPTLFFQSTVCILPPLYTYSLCSRLMATCLGALYPIGFEEAPGDCCQLFWFLCKSDNPHNSMGCTELHLGV